MSPQEVSPKDLSSIVRKPPLRIGHGSSGSLPQDWSFVLRKPPLWTGSSLLRKSCSELVLSPQEVSPRDRSSLLRKSCSGSVMSPQESSPQDQSFLLRKASPLGISHLSSGGFPLGSGHPSSESLAWDWSCLLRKPPLRIRLLLLHHLSTSGICGEAQCHGFSVHSLLGSLFVLDVFGKLENVLIWKFTSFSSKKAH